MGPSPERAADVTPQLELEARIAEARAAELRARVEPGRLTGIA
jgi:hypothetical protein